MAISLYNTVQEEELTLWTEEEIERYKETEGFNSRVVTYFNNTNYGSSIKKTPSEANPTPTPAETIPISYEQSPPAL